MQYDRRQSDRAGLSELLRIRKRRLQELETKAAFYGASSDPALTMEIADLRLVISDLEQKLRPPGLIPTDVWLAMSPDDQRRYLITLVMGLQADFSECRAKLNQRAEWLMGAVIVLELVNLAVRAMT